MSVIGSVSQWIRGVRSGDEQSLAELHRRYWPRLVELAGKKMRGATLRDRDPEDIAQISFLAVYESIRHQRAPDLDNRHQFLAFMTHVIACKTVNELKHANAAKRGGGLVGSLNALEALVERSDDSSPIESTMMKECYDHFVHSLPEKLIEIAELHLAGHSNREIAQAMGCVERTVERKLSLIRQHWRSLATRTLTTRSIPEAVPGNGFH